MFQSEHEKSKQAMAAFLGHELDCTKCFWGGPENICQSLEGCNFIDRKETPHG
jgi:hypothetical protein